MTTVAIIDDNRDFGRRLAAFVAAQPGCTVAGLAETAVAGLALVIATRSDLALVDIGLPAENGFWFAEQAAAQAPRTGVVLMSDGDPEEYAQAAALAGALAYLPKQAVSRHLPPLLRFVVDPASGRARTGAAPGGSTAGTTAAMATRRRDAATEVTVTEVNMLLATAGAALYGFAAVGQPGYGLVAAVLLLCSFILRQRSSPRALCGHAGGRELRRAPRAR